MWTDGACKGNPGPGGWGVLLRFGEHEKELYGGLSSTTNNQMELTAVIEGLRALTRPSRVELHVDSTYVMKGITEWIHNWKRNGWRTAAKKPVANAELWRELEEQAARHDISWAWVRGHAGGAGKERAGARAKRGVVQVEA